MDPSDVDVGLPWAQASLRIASDTLNGDAISELLGMSPSSTRTSEGEPTFTVWMHDQRLEPSVAIEDHVYLLADELRDREEALAGLSEVATVEIWLSFSAGRRHVPAVLDSALLARLGALGVDLVLDPYPSL